MCDQRRAEKVAGKARLHIFPGKGGHLLVRLGARKSVLPMHGAKRDLPRGLVEAIKKQLGLR